MKLKEPKNKNYCGTIVQITTIVPLENCNNVQAAIIFGNQVIVNKSVKVGDIGIYFPIETQLSNAYLFSNNLYRKKELNEDKNQAGYFEENGRIRCVKFRGNKSEGLFMPLSSLDFANNCESVYPKINEDFDEFEGFDICKKYIPKRNIPGQTNSKNKGKKPKESKIIDNQFRFHQDTSMLYKNLDKIKPESLISITYKIHGTSGISSKVLCKKKLNWFEKFLKRLGINIVDTQYDYVWSSRKVIKNSDLNLGTGYYNEDIWGIAHNELKDFLQDGMTIYYEIAGFLPSGNCIQKRYDYGCKQGDHKIYIYRITHTNISGKVFEFSAKQVQDWCKTNGLNPVPELYYGGASGIRIFIDNITNIDTWRNDFLLNIKSTYNEKDCYLCRNSVPEEGVVIRIESNEFEAYKCKSNAFYELETKELDSGEVNIEEEN
jgi:hypothetical protein